MSVSEKLIRIIICLMVCVMKAAGLCILSAVSLLLHLSQEAPAERLYRDAKTLLYSLWFPSAQFHCITAGGSTE